MAAKVDNAPDAPEGEQRPDGAPAEGRPDVQLYGVAFCVFCCFVGQIFVWIKETAITPALNPGYAARTLGSYAFMMLLSAVVNLVSLRKGQPWLYWATVAVGLGVVLDVNICVTDWLIDAGSDAGRSGWNWELRLGYVLSLIGYVGSFGAMPVRWANFGVRDASSIIGVLLGVWLVVGNAAIWSGEGGLKAGSNVCPIGFKAAKAAANTGLPVHVSRAFTTGILHIFASAFRWESGLWLTFIIACVSIADYMPAGAGPGRCQFDGKEGCEVGVWLAFSGMWMVALAHIVLKGGKLVPDFSKANPLRGVRSASPLLGALMCVSGMVMVAVENHKRNDANKLRFGADVGQYKDLGAQETYDVVQIAIGSLFVWWSYLAANNRVGVAGVCLYFGVFNRLLGASDGLDFIGACPHKWSGLAKFGIHNNTDAVVRAGYILLLAGSLLSVVALLNVDGPTLDRPKAQIAGLFVLVCVAWLWSAEKWYGQMGLTALLGVAFHTYDYKPGLDAVFFWTCLQLASQTPFTTCEGPGSFLAFVVTLATLGLFYLAYLHLDVRGDAKGEPVAEEEGEQEEAVVAQQAAAGGEPEKMKDGGEEPQKPADGGEEPQKPADDGVTPA